MSAIQRLHPGQRLSEAAVHNGTVYLAGQIADDASQDIRGQTGQVLASIDRLLAEAGSDKGRILMAQIFLADRQPFGADDASIASATEARREVSESAREVSTIGTRAPTTMPAHSPPPM